MSTISHEDVSNMLKLSMLVYNYGKNFELKNNEDIEHFVKNLKNCEDHKNDESMSNIRRNALIDLSEECPHGKILTFINDTDTDLQAVVTVSETKKRISIIFRGSESIKDWYYDLYIFKQKLDTGARVHKGFYTQLTKNDNYSKLVGEIRSQLEQTPDYSIYVSGHSLGGALCTLFGYLLAHEIENHVTVVSFASPRIGDTVWKNTFTNKENLKHIRVTNDHDIVTSAPLINYKHVGDVIHLKPLKFKTFDDFSYNMCWQYSLLKNHSIRDHNCDLYYAHLLINKWRD